MIALLAKNASGVPLAGLSPTWTKYVNAATGSNQSAPSISSLGNGHYAFTPSGTSPAGIIDLGATAAPRYVHYAAVSAYFVFAAYDDTGTPLAGLSPSWSSLLNVVGGSAYTPQPSFTSIGSGLYKTDLLTTHVTGVIDLGSAAYPRYLHYDSEVPTIAIPIIIEE